MMRAVAVVLVLVLFANGCEVLVPLGNHLDGGESMILGSGGFSGAGGGASDMGGGTATSTVVTSWPTFTGDCRANGCRTVSATNGGGSQRG